MNKGKPEQQAQGSQVPAPATPEDYQQIAEQGLAELLVSTIVMHNAGRGVQTIQAHKRVKSGEYNYIVTIARIEL